MLMICNLMIIQKGKNYNYQDILRIDFIYHCYKNLKVFIKIFSKPIYTVWQFQVQTYSVRTKNYPS